MGALFTTKHTYFSQTTTFSLVKESHHKYLHGNYNTSNGLVPLEELYGL